MEITTTINALNFHEFHKKNRRIHHTISSKRTSTPLRRNYHYDKCIKFPRISKKNRRIHHTIASKLTSTSLIILLTKKYNKYWPKSLEFHLQKNCFQTDFNATIVVVISIMKINLSQCFNNENNSFSLWKLPLR